MFFKQSFLYNAEDFVINRHRLRFVEKSNTWNKLNNHLDDTGYAIWDGGVVLSKYFEEHAGEKILHNAHVLELGCGTGITGLSLGACGAQVVLTDQEVLTDFVKRNIRLNNGALCEANGVAQFRVLDWYSVTEFKLGTFNFIVAADVLWQPQAVIPFFNTVEMILLSLIKGKASVTRDDVCACATKLGGLQESQEFSHETESVASQLSLEKQITSNPSPMIIIKENDWLIRCINCSLPFLCLAYSFRDEKVHKLLLDTLEARFCYSKVPAHRIPFIGFRNKGGERDFSDDSNPPVFIYRIQLPCKNKNSSND